MDKNQKELIKKFEIIDNYIYSHTWNMLRKVFDYIPKSEIISKAWGDDWKNRSEYYPLDLTDNKTWQTYDDPNCISLKFSLTKDGKLILVAKIYDKVSWSDTYNLKFTTEIILPNEFISELESLINYHFNNYLENEYDKFLEKQKHDWIEAMSKKILSE